MQYDYDFLYYLKTILLKYRSQASSKEGFVAHTVAEEIVLYIIMKESEFLMESIIPCLQTEDDDTFSDWNHWPFDLFDDMDVITFLYFDSYLTQDHPYHFQHWKEAQFYCTP